MDNTSSLNNKIQKFGRFLSGMVMPNIGAFIAWGLITALFIDTGWLPNEKLVQLVDPMILYLLPLLIGFTGGRMVYGIRGGVLGAIGTMGVIVGTTIPMFIGAMIMGPLSAWVIKKTDDLFEEKIPTGFEMLVNNFSAGIVGGLLAILAFLGIGPAVEVISDWMGYGVEWIVEAGLLPIASILVEPAKVLFLNNAINHGVLSPLAIEQVSEVGKSVLFLIETNPGPGLGILLAYYVFTKGAIKQSAPGAIIIHFLGGIHEIYFPYILMQPKLILAVIAGGASGVFTFVVTGAGLVATPSPGSIIALLGMAAKGSHVSVLLGVIISTVVTFLVASLLIKRDTEDDSLETAKQKSKDMKVKKNSEGTASSVSLDNDKAFAEADFSQVKRIAVACDAGMGSSAMGASKLQDALKKKGLKTKVKNYSIDNIPKNADVIITHESLAARAMSEAPFGIHLTLTDFLMTDVYAQVAEKMSRQHANPKSDAPSHKETESKAQETTATDNHRMDANDKSAEESNDTLTKANIRINLPTMPKEEAIRLAGQILFEGGYVEEEYIDAMVQRDSELSTYIGNGTAIPHGVSEAKKKIKRTGISILQFPEGVDFDGNEVYLVVGIAGVGNEHLMILSNLAEIVEDEDKVELIRRTDDVNYIYQLFTS